MNNKTIAIIVIIVGAIVVLGGLILLLTADRPPQKDLVGDEPLKVPTAPAPQTPVEQSLPADSTETIQKELDALDLGDLDTEFQGIDSDLNQL